MDKRNEIIHHLQAEIAALESRLDSNNNLILSLREQLKVHEANKGDDRREQIFRRAAVDLLPESSDKEFPSQEPITLKDMGDALIALGHRLDHKYAETRALIEISDHINAGKFFDDVMDHVFENFTTLLPYDRLGVALIEKESSGRRLVRWHWVRAKYEPLMVQRGYVAVLDGSSLEETLKTGEPRITNDLKNYLKAYPNTPASRAVLKEGIKSSLTCPLVLQGTVTGFLFFSSLQLNTYREQHVDILLQITGKLAYTLEKSRAYEELTLRNEFIKKVFGQYMEKDVVESILNSDCPLALGGDRRKVTVLMADLRDFTPMSEILPPEDVVDALNVFLGVMNNIVIKYGGSVDNIIGDALMAVFGIMETQSDDTARAVACAVDMQKSMALVNMEIEERGLPKLSIGIGLSTGDVVAGNIGSEIRLKYSVIGRTVNLAARIEALASGGQIFASDTTFTGVKEIVRTAGHLNVKLKGLEHPVPVHEVTGIDGEFI